MAPLLVESSLLNGARAVCGPPSLVGGQVPSHLPAELLGLSCLHLSLPSQRHGEKVISP